MILLFLSADSFRPDLKALVNIVLDRKKIRSVLAYLYNYVQVGE